MSAVEESTLNSLSAPPYEGQEFLYRPIPLLVPISLGFVFLSFVAAMMAELLIIPVMGAALAFIAWRQIRASGGGLSGGGLAITSLISQIVLTIAFATVHVYSFATEVPPGFERVNFSADISKKGFSNIAGRVGIHPDVQKLVDQKVMIKGYMYPTKAMEGLKSFVLCRDNGVCCFGGQPNTADMILIHMKGSNAARFQTGLVSVAGVFRAEPTVDETGLQPVYQLDCEFFGPAKTWY
jgi:hypothetical protein